MQVQNSRISGKWSPQGPQSQKSPYPQTEGTDIGDEKQRENQPKPQSDVQKQGHFTELVCTYISY